VGGVAGEVAFGFTMDRGIVANEGNSGLGCGGTGNLRLTGKPYEKRMKWAIRCSKLGQYGPSSMYRNLDCKQRLL